MGAWKVILTVELSRASTEVMSANELLAVQPVASSVQYCQVKTTSWAVRSLPSDHLRSSLRFQVIEVRSWEMPRFWRVGMSSARAGTRAPFGSYLAKGSRVMAPASLSLNPPER